MADGAACLQILENISVRPRDVALSLAFKIVVQAHRAPVVSM